MRRQLSNDDMKKELAKWKNEKDSKDRMDFITEKKYCRGTSCETAVTIFCKDQDLSGKSKEEILSFIKWAKAEGYNVSDPLVFCRAWSEGMKKKKMGLARK